jgi:hypothetical protein
LTEDRFVQPQREDAPLSHIRRAEGTVADFNLCNFIQESIKLVINELIDLSGTVYDISDPNTKINLNSENELRPAVIKRLKQCMNLHTIFFTQSLKHNYPLFFPPSTLPELWDIMQPGTLS